MEYNEITEKFQFDGEVKDTVSLDTGHINDTCLITFSFPDNREEQYILQKINKNVFHNPSEVMENMLLVTTYMREEIIKNGGDPERETINLLCAKDGKAYVTDDNGDYWRGYKFITDARTYDYAQTPEDFYKSAVAFGNFQRILSDFPVEKLHETIKGFHDTKTRFARFKDVVAADVCARADGVKEEIEFYLSHEELANVFYNIHLNEDVHLRVTHNDTKLNNVLIDDKTRRGICVIDLDTVMAGLAMNDFGDSIRFGASTAAEDEVDLSKVSLDLNLFEVYTKGFMEGCGGQLTQKEIELLPMGAKVMTYECGMRFLTDYLQGDTYFKTHRAGHNLDRSRTHIKLLQDMEEKWDMMQQIVEKYKNHRA